MRTHRASWLAFGAFLLLAIPGCISPPVPTSANVLILEYTLVNTVDPEAGRQAMPGDHCARAWIDGGTVVMQESEHAKIEDAERFLVVDPDLEGRWGTMGTEPFALALPAEVDAYIADDPGPWTRIEVGHDDIVRVDGRPVTLPHAWSVTAADRTWRVDAHLAEGPAAYRVVPDRPCF